MPVFIFLLFLAAGFLWLLLAFTFIPLGKVFNRLIKGAKEAMSMEDQTENKEDKENSSV